MAFPPCVALCVCVSLSKVGPLRPIQYGVYPYELLWMLLHRKGLPLLL